jgi:hypothetical protein
LFKVWNPRLPVNAGYNTSVDREEFHNRFRQLAESQNQFDLSRWEPDAGVLSQN